MSARAKLRTALTDAGWTECTAPGQEGFTSPSDLVWVEVEHGEVSIGDGDDEWVRVWEPTSDAIALAFCLAAEAAAQGGE